MQRQIKTLEDQVYFSCAAYSCIHPNRAAVLNHLFCVIGNGYEWDEDGRLVECCGETTYKNGRRKSMNAAINGVFRRRREHDQFSKREARKWKRQKHAPDPAGNARLDELIDRAVAAMKAEKERDPAAYEAKVAKQEKEWAEQRRKWREEKKWDYRVPGNIQERTKATAGYNNWYPMCQYSRMLTYPSNIQPDYLDGIIETCNLIIASPPTARPGYYPNDPQGTASAKVSQQTVELAKEALSEALALKCSREAKTNSQ